MLHSVYFLSVMLCPIALRPTTPFGWSFLALCHDNLRHVTASLRLQLQEICGWLLQVEREDLLLACKPLPFLCAMFGPLAEGAAVCSVLYARVNLRTTDLTLA